jgi:two-component system sensor histidine kinase UhpB
MATDTFPQATASSDRTGSLPSRLRLGDLTLYARVVAVNTAILLTALVVLVLTPATVSFPVAAEQGLILAIGAVVIVAANAALLRVNFRGLSTLVRRMETLDVLQPQDRLDETGGQDARALIAGFNAMLQRLEAERRTSTRRTLSALESERRRIGLELHDEIGQRLTGTLLQLRNLGDQAPEPLRSRLEAIAEQERATLDEVGALAWQLRPALLDDLGLLSALAALADSLEDRAATRIEVTLPDALSQMPPALELVVYRIAQEALTNAVRHSGAARIELQLEEDLQELRLRVADDGHGLSVAALEGPGIRGMRERGLVVDGRLSIGPNGRHGVRVLLTVARPYPPL